METNFALNLPLNAVSFGQTSIAILKELHKRGYNPVLFPIGQIDLGAQNLSPEFGQWLQQCINDCHSRHKRSLPIFKLWHLEGSLESFSEKQILFSFYELDSPTKAEVNTVKNNTKVIFSSKYSVRQFQDLGLNNVHYVPLGFDADNFKKKDKQYFDDGRIIFNLVGKFEKRKHHDKVLRAWTRRFGQDGKYFLNCAIFNVFQPAEQQHAEISHILGKKYDNLHFLGFMPKNEQYNDYLNSGDIVIGVSGGEGFGLPEMQSVALGKHAVILNAHAYKDWANEQNAVLLNPAGKEESYDGKHFHKGYPYNQGFIYTFDEDEFIHCCEQAIERFKQNKINEAGLKLQEEYTYSKTVDEILKLIN